MNDPTVKQTIYSFVILAFALFLISVAERLFLVNATFYPSAMVDEDLGKSFTEDWLVSQRNRCGDPLEMFPKKEGRTIIRCGMVWPLTTTWVVDTDALMRVAQ